MSPKRKLQEKSDISDVKSQSASGSGSGSGGGGGGAIASTAVAMKDDDDADTTNTTNTTNEDALQDLMRRQMYQTMMENTAADPRDSLSKSRSAPRLSYNESIAG